MENIKVALVHDWLTGRRGGEKVLEVMAELFPRAPIYTLFHFSGSQDEILERKNIKTSFLQRMPGTKKRYRSYLPFFPLAVELFDLQSYDLILSSSHCVAKGAIPSPEALHISYIHSPVRYAWNQYFSYFSSEKLSFFSRILIPPVIHRLRIWDESSSSRVDHFIANSQNVAQRIQKYYRRTAHVIHPPVETEFFQPSDQDTEDYYLIVSALVPYKRIDVAVEAFNQTQKKLKIVGQGPQYRELRKKAYSNIEFMGFLEGSRLLRVYQRARALIIPGEEDFGINSLESQACGVPVVAYGKGGATETVIDEKTGLFFSQLNSESLRRALDRMESLNFNKSSIRNNALRFSREKFKENLSLYIQQKWDTFKRNQ